VEKASRVYDADTVILTRPEQLKELPPPSLTSELTLKLRPRLRVELKLEQGLRLFRQIPDKEKPQTDTIWGFRLEA
jgi:hypothetical protein